MYLGTFSKILSPGIRLGWVVAPPPVLEKINLGKQARRPVHLDALPADGAGLLRAGPTGATTSTRSPSIYRARRDTMLDALAEHFPPQAEWTRPAGGLFIWATLPGLHRHDRPAGAGAARERRLRARRGGLPRRPRAQLDAAQLLRRRDEDAIREGIRRIGEVVDRAGRALRHAHRRARAAPGGRAPAPRPSAERRARAADCPRRRSAARRASAVSRVAVLKGGRSLERQVSLRSGARVEDALERLGHEVVAIDVGARPDRAAARGASRTWPSSRMHGRDGEDGTVQELLEIARHPLHRLGRAGLHRARWTRCWPSTCCSRPASRRPSSSPSTRPPSASSAPPRRCRRSRSGSTSRSW